RAWDEAPAQHPPLPSGGVVEHGGLARRDAVLAVEEVDFDARPSPTQPCRPRRPRGAHLDEHLVPARAQRVVDGVLAQPIDLAQPHPAGAQRLARPDHHAARRRIEPHHIERMAGGDAEPAALADGEVDDAGMSAQQAAVKIDDVARLGRAGLEPLDHLGVAARRHEADVLAIVLVGDREAEPTRQLARLRLGLVAEREAQHLELLARGGKEKIALIALLLARAIERAAAARERPRGDVMPGRQHLGAELVRGREQIAELDRLVALDAWHRRLARHIALGEAVDYHFLEAALVVEHVVGNADPLRHRARVIDVLAGAAGALAMGRGAVVVELQRDADDVVAFGLEQGGRDRGVDAARHGDHHTGVPRRAFDIEAIEHCGCFRREPLRGPAPMSSGRASRHLIIGTRCRDRTAARGGPAVWSIGLVPGGARATSRYGRRPAGPRRSGHAHQIIGSKDVLARPPVGRARIDGCGPWAVSPPRAKLARSARVWLRRNNRYLVFTPRQRPQTPLPRPAAARNLQSLGRRRHGCRRQCGRHRPEFRQILSAGHYLPRDLAVECVRSLMTEPLRPRAKYVIGPDGSPLTIADLPAPGTKRWVIRRKAEVVAAVRGGLLSLEEACSRYTLTVEEFLSWQYSIDQHGLAGLRTTRIQQYRQ